MRILITGGRSFTDERLLFAQLDRLHDAHSFSLLIHGDARGADRLAGDWALQRGIEVLSCPADWRRHGRAAGMLRNKQMLKYEPELLVAFPGGTGTKNMITLARDAGIQVVHVKAKEAR